MQGHISKYTDRFLFWSYLLFFVSIIFSFRGITSLSIALILLLALLTHSKTNHVFSVNRSFIFFLVGSGLLFIAQCLSLIYTRNIDEGMVLLQRRSALILIPLAVLSGNHFLTIEKRERLLSYFSILLCLASLYCLGTAFFKYAAGAPVAIFFYHDLVKPISQHAIQFSILVFIALVFLTQSSLKGKNTTTNKLLTWFLSMFLVLLTSKLVVCFYIFYLLYFFLFKNLRRKGIALIALAFISIVIILLAVPSPVEKRFREMFSGNFTLFTHEKFHPDIYFNGVQFRLLQWRFTYQILRQHDAWISGLSPGDAQQALDQKYIETKMYTGTPGTGNRGFLGYHTHNQYLQIALENGIPGLLIFLFISYSLIKMAMADKIGLLKPFVMLILLYCFTDAPLETQYGLVLFTFFPFFVGLSHKKKLRTKMKPELCPKPHVLQ